MSRITLHRAPIARLTGLVAAAALGVAFTAAPAPAAAPPDSSLQTVSNLVAPSIVQLRTQYAGLVRDGQGLAVNGGRPIKVDTTCSGFIVNTNGYIATAGRCVDLDVAIDRLIDGRRERRVQEPARPGAGGHEPARAEGRGQA
jgi:hypothetical protein